MKNKDIERLISDEGDALVESKKAKILAECGVEGKVKIGRPAFDRPRFSRTLAVAAIVALLAVGMAALVPLAFENKELPPDTEGIKDITGENEQITSGSSEGISQTDNTEPTTLPGIVDLPYWTCAASTPYAIIEVIEKTDEVYYSKIYNKSEDQTIKMPYRKIKCRVIFSCNTESYDSNANYFTCKFSDTEYIYVAEPSADEFINYSAVFIEIKKLDLDSDSTSKNVYSMPTDNDGNASYIPFVEGKLIFDEKNLNFYIRMTNKEIDIISSKIERGEKNLFEFELAFSKKYFESGMTFEDVMEFFYTLDEAERLFVKYLQEIYKSGSLI